MVRRPELKLEVIEEHERVDDRGYFHSVWTARAAGAERSVALPGTGRSGHEALGHFVWLNRDLFRVAEIEEWSLTRQLSHEGRAAMRRAQLGYGNEEKAA